MPGSELVLPTSNRSPGALVILFYAADPNAWLRKPTQDTNDASRSALVASPARTASRFANLAARLCESQIPFFALDPAPVRRPRDHFTNFFCTYNRTEIQEQVRRLVAACKCARKVAKAKRVVLCGIGRAGLWALLAAPAADAVIADCSQLDVSDDEAMLGEYVFCPGIRNIGGFEGAAILAAPHPLLLHNTGRQFGTEALQSTYHAIGASRKLRIESRPLADEELVSWAARN